MGPYSLKQRVCIIRTYYENFASVRETHRALITLFGEEDCPSEQTIKNLAKKFEASGSVLDIKPTVRARSRRSVDTIKAVRQSVEKEPNLSLRQRAKIFGMSLTTMLRILTDDLGIRSTNIENDKIPKVPINETEVSK